MSHAQTRPSAYSSAFYAAQADRERTEGDAAMLGNVRAKHHLAAAAWLVLANRAEAGSIAVAGRAAQAATLIALPNENPDRIER